MNLRKCLCIAGVFAAISIQGAAAACNPVDAVTTASFKITGGQACSTTVDLEWTFTKTNSTLNIEYGPTTTYGTKKEITPRTSPFKISALTPNTTYNYHIWGIHRDITHEYTKSTFKTAASGAVAIAPPAITRSVPSADAIYFGTTRLNVPGFSGQPLNVSLYSLNGSRIMSRSIPLVNRQNGHIALPAAMTPGIYLATISTVAGSNTQSIVIR